jgi:hypothetical protein
MVSAMSPVTPKPAAEFSTLATTKSIERCSTSAGTARFAISRPGLPKMSPMNRMRTSLDPDGNAKLAAPPFLEAWQEHAQLAALERRVSPACVERTREPDGAREAPEDPLGDVKCGAVLADGGPFVADDDERIPYEEDLQGIGRDARDVHEEHDAVRGLDHIEGRREFRRRANAPGSVVQPIEETAQFVVQVPGVEKNASHSVRILTVRSGSGGASVTSPAGPRKTGQIP